jgi:hypothetical protein
MPPSFQLFVLVSSRTNRDLLEIEFESPQSVFAVLKSKKLLSNNQFWKNIWITTELTALQRSILSDIKKEHDKRNSLNNGIWFIKYICGSPTLARKN